MGVAWNAIQTDVRLKKFQKALLQVGNIVCEGQKRGNAQGFKVMSVKAFINCRSNDLSCVLMDYVLDQILSVDPELMDFAEELHGHLKKIEKYSIERQFFICFKKIELCIDVENKIMAFKKIMLQILINTRSPTPDQGYLEFFHKFLMENYHKIQKLEKDALDQRIGYHDTLLWLGESENMINSIEFSNVYLNDHMKNFENTYKCFEALKQRKSKERHDADLAKLNAGRRARHHKK